MKKILFIIFLFYNNLNFSQEIIIKPHRNWLFRGVENIMQIEGSDIEYSFLFIRTPEKTISVDENGFFKFTANKRCHPYKISAFRIMNRDTLLLCEQNFQIKEIPAPTAYIGNYLTSGLIKKNDYIQQKKIKLEVLNYNLPEIEFELLSYSIIVVRDTKSVYMNDFTGEKFDKDMLDTFKKILISGDRIFITNITLSTDYRFNKILNSIDLVIE